MPTDRPSSTIEISGEHTGSPIRWAANERPSSQAFAPRPSQDTNSTSVPVAAGSRITGQEPGSTLIGSTAATTLAAARSATSAGSRSRSARLPASA